MPNVEVIGLAATCGHGNTASNTVFIGGQGATRVAADAAGGMIIGPGSQTVWVEGYRVSLPGDAIVAHSPCPDPGSHCAATTNGGGNQSNVFAGTGFMGDGGPIIEPNLTASMGVTDLQVYASGQGHYPINQSEVEAAWVYCCENPGPAPPTGCVAPPGLIAPPPIEIPYTVTNEGNHTSQPCVVGFYSLPYNNPAVVVEGIPDGNYPEGVVLLDTENVPALEVNETFESSFTLQDSLSAGSVSMQPEYYYQVYPDIHMTTTEPYENNTVSQVTVVTVNFGC